MVLDDEDRPRRFIEPLDDSVQVDEGRPPLHGRPQPDVVPMIRIGAAIAIAEEAAVDEPVIVGAIPVLDRRGGRDGEGDLGQDGWFEDPLRSDQRDPDAFELEAPFEDGARDGRFAEASPLLRVEVEGVQADRCVAVVSHGGQGRAERVRLRQSRPDVDRSSGRWAPGRDVLDSRSARRPEDLVFIEAPAAALSGADLHPDSCEFAGQFTALGGPAAACAS